MRRAGALIALLAAGAATPALAQSYKKYGTPADTPEVTARILLAGAARCALNDVPSSVRKVLATDPASKSEAKAVKSMESVTPKCFAADRGETNPILVRNALAEASYHVAYRRAAPDVSSQTKTPPASFGVAPADAKGTPEQEGAWMMAALANCTVFASSAGVRDLIMVPIGVPEEQQQFDALKPAMARCMDAKTLAMLTPENFRGYLAAALWRQAEKAAK